MFGHDDNQQPVQDNNGAMQAAMPDPLGDDGQGQGTAPANQPFDESAALSGAPSMSEPAVTTPTNPGSSTDAPSDSGTSSPTSAPNEDLLNLKQKALQHLSPLVSHLEQTPEEKFRTTMMMIQASDDQSLVKTAFEAAQAITDDKARAQALLDIINEINYFTQHQNQG